MQAGIWPDLQRGESHEKDFDFRIRFNLTVISTGAFADEEAAISRQPRRSGKVSRTIEITMVENRFKPSEINVKQGETIKFVLKNTGKKKHEMMIGTPEEMDKHAKMMKKFPDMEHPDEPNMISVDPGKTGELIWHFTEAGR